LLLEKWSINSKIKSAEKILRAVFSLALFETHRKSVRVRARRNAAAKLMFGHAKPSP
jgi:hypothetical protein